MNKAGQITLLIDSIEKPDSIGIFPGGKTLIVSNSDGRKKKWYAYDIASDGSLTNASGFYDVSNEKGMGGCDGFLSLTKREICLPPAREVSGYLPKQVN
jgi:gluconolactonase